MARRAIVLQTQSNFNGGLNISADAKNVAANELIDTQSVDIWPYGGVHRRKTVYRLNPTALTAVPRAIAQYIKSSGTQQLVVQTGNTIAEGTTAGTFTDEGSSAPWDVTTNGKMRFATMARLTGSDAAEPKLYICRNAEQVAVVFDGSSGTALTAAGFNDDLTTPAGGKFPTAKLCVVHAGFMWAANTVESSTSYLSRLRFSHPNEPEDWRTDDYIDIGEGDDGDEITALASFQGRLIVFKRRSIHVITGVDPESFQAVELTRKYGAVSAEAVSVSDHGVGFYDPEFGPMEFDGRAVQWIGEKLYPTMRDTVQDAFLDTITVTWFGPRLYFSVPWNAGDEAPSRTFIFDTRIGRYGSWTTHEFGCGPGVHFRPTGASDAFFACSTNQKHVLQIDFGEDADHFGLLVSTATWTDGVLTVTTTTDHMLEPNMMVNIIGVDPDEFNIAEAMIMATPSDTTFEVMMEDDPGTYTSDGSVEQYFGSSVITSWYDGDTPGLKKRWKRASYVLHNEHASQFNVKVWHNFDASRVIREMTVVTDGTDVGGVWGDDWGFTWGSGDADASTIVRGVGLGRAYAVRVKITGPMHHHWGLNAIDLRYIPNRVR